MARWLWGVVASLLAVAPVSAQEVLRIGTEGAYPPWNMTRPDGALEGFEIDLGNALCARMGVTCAFVVQDWDGIIPALDSGRFDVIMSGMSATDERRRHLAFTDPYAATASSFIARRDSPLQQAETLDEVEAALAGRQVGAQLGTNSYDFLRQRFGDAIDVRTYDTLETLILDLTAGRLDAGFSKTLTWQEFLGTEEGRDFALFGPALTRADFAGFEEVAMGLRLDDATWRERLNRALAELRADGTLRDLHLKWFGTDAYLP